jgi:hypothetical protein
MDIFHNIIKLHRISPPQLTEDCLMLQVQYGLQSLPLGGKVYLFILASVNSPKICGIMIHVT